ncbi:GNAT family N-acetyltransferase [Polaromonas sp. P2-4]|nr:GNAT family N-acetyltransferase [Polaromonas sp. P2-4]
MIREFEAADIEPLMVIWRSAAEQAHDFLSRGCLQQWEPYVRACIEGFETFSYVVNGQCVGFICLSDKEIHLLYVSPKCQKEGIGRQFLDFVKSKIDSLTLKVHSKNASAMRFYEQNGFEFDGEVTNDSFSEPQKTMSWRVIG